MFPIRAESRASRVFTLTQAINSLLAINNANDETSVASINFDETNRRTLATRQIVENEMDSLSPHSGWEEVAHQEAAEAANKWAKKMQTAKRTEMEKLDAERMASSTHAKFKQGVRRLQVINYMDPTELKQVELDHMAMYAQLALVIKKFTGEEMTGNDWAIECISKVEGLHRDESADRNNSVEVCFEISTTEGAGNAKIRLVRQFTIVLEYVLATLFCSTIDVAAQWSQLVDVIRYKSYFSKKDFDYVESFWDKPMSHKATRQFVDICRAREIAARLFFEKSEDEKKKLEKELRSCLCCSILFGHPFNKQVPHLYKKNQH